MVAGEPELAASRVEAWEAGRGRRHLPWMAGLPRLVSSATVEACNRCPASVDLARRRWIPLVAEEEEEERQEAERQAPTRPTRGTGRASSTASLRREASPPVEERALMARMATGVSSVGRPGRARRAR